jgi:single-strand DNA-binding protein
MYQKVMILGHLGRDPNMRYTPSGVPVCDFSVATNRKWKTQDGADGEETTWFQVTTWRGLAENCNRYLSKGRAVLIEGELKPGENGAPRVYQRRDGTWGAQFELTARTVKFLGGRNDNGNGYEPSEPPPGFDEDTLDTIPF